MEKDEEVCVGVLMGAGDKAFSAGDDLKSMAARADSTLMDWRLWHPVKVTTGHTTTKPVIAAIQGYCIGGGLELALVCDIRIAADNAMFAAPEVKWNRICGMAALKLAYIMPMSSAMEFLLTGDFLDAKEAYRLGLVSRVVPVADLMPTAVRLAEKIASNPTLAVQWTKELAYRAREMTLADGLRYFEALEKVLGARDKEMARKGVIEGPQAYIDGKKNQP
jgi:enoyl-CoA hydratase/carnithine racemase